MNEFYLSRKISARLSLRAAVRMFCILTLALWGPAMAGAQAQTQPLDVASTSINDKLTLTYKLKPNSSTDYAWFYKVGTNGSDTEFSGTLTGTNDDWQHGAIDIKSEKKIEDPNHDKLDSYPILQLDGLNLTYNANDSLLYMVQNGNPLCIQATGSSASTLKCQGVVINNYVGCDLLLDGGAAGLNILGKGYSNGIYLYTTGHSVDLILKGKINIVADNKYGVSIGNSASLSAAKDAKITASGGLKAILDNNVHSPFLEWRFEASLGSGKTLEIKDANGDTRLIPLSNSPPTTKISISLSTSRRTPATPFGWAMNNSWMRKKEPSLRRRRMEYPPSRKCKLFLPTGPDTLRQPMSARMASMSPSP